MAAFSAAGSSEAGSMASSGGRQRLWSAARLLLLVLVVATCWGLAHQRVTPSAWNVPLDYAGDSVLILARIKAAAEGHYAPLVSKTQPALGAPFVANWDPHPTSEDLLYFLTGHLARRIGLFPAANLAVLLAHILAALSFYAAARMLRARPEWAFATAVAFALSPFAFDRGLPHLVLAYDWHIPLVLLAGWWMVTTRPEHPWNAARTWLIAGVAFVTGIQNAYYTFLFVQFAGLALLVQAIRRNRRGLGLALLAGTTALLAWTMANVDSLAAHVRHGTPLTASRSYSDVVRFALRPAALFAPPQDHRASWWASWGEFALRHARRGNEANRAYLGLAAIGGLAWLAWVSALRIGRRRRPPALAWPVAWIVLFSVPLGLNTLLGRAGFTMFRATNRYSIAIMAAALLFLAQALTGATRRWPWWPRAALTAALCLITAWDQVPRTASPAALDAVRRRVNSDRTFVERLEARLGEHAMVFQLPVMVFPEAPPVRRMGSYDHLRLYLFSTRLRFSFGNHQANAGAEWADSVAHLEIGEMAGRVADARFSAIQIDRSAYRDRGEGLLRTLRAEGWPEKIESPDAALVALIRAGRGRPPVRP